MDNQDITPEMINEAYKELYEALKQYKDDLTQELIKPTKPEKEFMITSSN